jgi:hypothetical protein
VTILDLFQSNGTVGYSDGLVTVNYLLEGGTTVTREYTLVRPGTSDSRAGRRRSINVADEIGNGQRFAIEILSPRPISAARLSYSGQEVADTIGSPTPDYVWNLAEGFTAFGFETWLAIFNPGSQTANLTVQFQLQNGTQTAYNYSVGARRRQTIYVNSLVPATSFSTQVVSDQPVVVERTMKFAAREGMHQSMGVRQ